MFVAFATEAVLFDALGGEVLIDGETIGVVGFLVSNRVVNLNDLVALEARAVERSCDTIPKLGAWLDGAASDTRRSRRTRSRVMMMMMMLRLRIGLSFLHHRLLMLVMMMVLMLMIVLVIVIVVVLIEHLLLLLVTVVVVVVVKTTTS